MQEIKTYTLVLFRPSDSDENRGDYQDEYFDIEEFETAEDLIRYWARHEEEDKARFEEYPTLDLREYTLLLDGRKCFEPEEDILMSEIKGKVRELAGELAIERRKKETERQVAMRKRAQEEERKREEKLKSERILEAKRLLKDNGITQI